jgi:YD repeat-containing protein
LVSGPPVTATDGDEVRSKRGLEPERNCGFDRRGIALGAIGPYEFTGETWVNPAGGTPIDVFHFTCNSDGELTAVSDDNSAYQYAYNADGEETSQADVGSPDLPSVTLT